MKGSAGLGGGMGLQEPWEPWGRARASRLVGLRVSDDGGAAWAPGVWGGGGLAGFYKVPEATGPQSEGHRRSGTCKEEEEKKK